MSQGIEDLKEEILTLKARVEELERQQPRPIPNEWMFTCKAPKCGCEGDPRWHADKAAAQRAAQGPSPYDPVTIKRNTRPPPCSSESQARSRSMECLACAMDRPLKCEKHS